MSTPTTHYYLTIDGQPTTGWPRTFATRDTAQQAASEAATRIEGRTIGIAVVPADWELTPEGEIGWLVGGPEGLRYQRTMA